jgi:hypothetical protein
MEDRDKSKGSKSTPVDHDTHGNEFIRTPGPGPKDAGKGAQGPDATERIEKVPPTEKQD